MRRFLPNYLLWARGIGKEVSSPFVHGVLLGGIVGGEGGRGRRGREGEEREGGEEGWEEGSFS